MRPCFGGAKQGIGLEGGKKKLETENCNNHIRNQEKKGEGEERRRCPWAGNGENGKTSAASPKKNLKKGGTRTSKTGEGNEGVNIKNQHP